MAPRGGAVLALIDNDVRTADPHVTKAEQAGATVVRWDLGFSIEGQICSELDAAELQEFISLGMERRGAGSIVLDDINSRDQSRRVPNLTVAEWLLIRSLEDARQLVALAASHGKRGWFKDVDGGRAVGEWLGIREAGNRQTVDCERGRTAGRDPRQAPARCLRQIVSRGLAAVRSGCCSNSSSPRARTPRIDRPDEGLVRDGQLGVLPVSHSV